MIYVGLLVLLSIWTWIAWKGRPLREFARIYFLSCALTALSEPFLIRLLHAYEMHAWLLPDREADFALTAIIVGLFLDPLLGVLYTRYCRRHPVVLALVVSALLGALEWYMVIDGSMIYLRSWSPLITVAFYFVFFLAVCWADKHGKRIPIWVDTYGLAAFWAYGTDLFLQGILALWEYQVVFFGNGWDDTRTLSDLLMSFAICPLAALVATAPLRYRWVWVGATGIALWTLEMVTWNAGLILMDGGTAALEILRRLALVTLTALYAGWIRAAGGE